MDDIRFERTSIASCPRGSWKWQYAYHVVVYRVHQTKDGRLIWRHFRSLTGRMSIPQIRRGAYKDLPFEAPHNKPLSATDAAAYRYLNDPAARDVDDRPDTMIPEDYHA
jgi:hypothetical protein